MEDLRYPIGKYVPEEGLTPERREELIAQVESAPARVFGRRMEVRIGFR